MNNDKNNNMFNSTLNNIKHVTKYRPRKQEINNEENNNNMFNSTLNNNHKACLNMYLQKPPLPVDVYICQDEPSMISTKDYPKRIL